MKPTARTFHCTEAGSSKFWAIATLTDGKTFTVTFGKIGTAGQSKEKTFPTVEACEKETARLICEKTAKGYIEQGSSSASVSSSPVAKSSGKSPAPAAAKNKFTKADYKAAAKILISLDLPSIDALIATGIPLNEPLFAPSPSWNLDTATGILIHHAAAHPLSNGIDSLRAHGTHVDNILAHIIARGATVDPAKASAIIYSCLFKTLDHLIAEGYDINTRNQYGKSHLDQTEPDIIEHLLARGADPRKAPEILHTVAISGTHALLRRLLEDYGLPLDTIVGGKTLGEAANGFYESITVHQLPAAQKDAASKFWANRPDTYGHTPAQRVVRFLEQEKNRNYLLALVGKEPPPPPKLTTTAADQSLLDTCKTEKLRETDDITLYLRARANPSSSDPENGRTPLHYIAAQHYPHIIEQGLRLLLDAGADPHALDDDSRTPLFHFFTGYADSEGVAGKLVAAGIDTAHKDSCGNNALAHMLASAPIGESHDARYTAKALLRVGVPATDCDRDGNNALHLIASKHDLGGKAEELIQLAIEKGADINARNKNGYTPLHLAVLRPETDRRNWHDDIIRELLRNKADVNAQDRDGNTSIHLCAVPREDLALLVGANPDLSIANNRETTAFQNIKYRGYYDAEEHGALVEMIEALILDPAATRDFPSLTWNPAPLNRTAKPPAQLRIVSSFHIQSNDADDALDHVGANRLAITGNIPETVTVFDTLEGKISWQIEDCHNGPGNIAHDDRAIYITREIMGSRFITAHRPDTGAQLWRCGLSSSDSQFGTPLLCTPNYVVHANQHAGKIYPIHKETGKKYTAALLNPYPRQKSNNKHDWGARMDDPRWRRHSLIPYGDTLLVLGVKKGTRTIAIDQYDLAADGAHMRTVFELEEEVQPLSHHHIHGDHLHLFTTAAEILKIHIPTGKAATIPMLPAAEAEQHRYSVESHHVAGEKLHYLLSCHSEDLLILNTYDLATSTITATHIAKEKNLPYRTQLAANSETLIYCIGLREIAIYDVARRKATELKLPNYGGYDWINQTCIIGNALYIAQKGGLKNTERTAILHRIQ